MDTDEAADRRMASRELGKAKRSILAIRNFYIANVILCAVALGFIGLLIFVNQDRQDQAAVATPSTEQSAPTGQPVLVEPEVAETPTTTETATMATTLPPPSTATSLLIAIGVSAPLPN